MEAVPRLPMVSFQLKVSPEPTSFGKLKQYIRDFYNEDPESYTNEIHQLENLRAMAVRPPIAITGCSLLKKYYCQLHFVQSRFPMGTDEPAAVSFTWKDTYANMVFTLSNIRFEISSILYNIGAIHSQLGGKTERTSADGMKMACSHFQCAAWAFEHLQNSYPQGPGVDMTPELMKFMHQLSLAQAQECILEKSMLDNRKPTIVAKVAKQIVDYYNLAFRTLEPSSSEESAISETVGSKVFKSWKNYVKFKRSYHMAVTYLYQGLAAEEQQKMGERVAFYNAALASLNGARSLHAGVKGSGGITGVAAEKDAIEDALVFTNDVIEGKRKAAKNENEFIYHEEVPDKDVLPTVNGASLVKGISFNVNDPEISGPDIFARLVPMKVHEASSMYSEEKAKILRSVGGKIEEKDQVLETYLSSLKLQHLSLWDPDASGEEYLALPEELVERCAALNAKPSAIKDLEDIMSKLFVTYGDVENMLKDIDKLLKEEEQKERQYQEAMGKRPPSIVATDLTREAKKYEEAHAKASESNQALHRAMTMHLNNLQILSQPLSELMSHIPSVKTSDGAEAASEADKQNIRELKRILGKVEEMQKQRSDLHSKLRDSIAQDNLTRLLVTATAESVSLDALFSEQLEKHQSLVGLIDQNLSAQDNILTALTDAYARTAETRKSVEETLKRREMMISSLIASYDAYEDLLAKSSKGLEFYRKLEVNVTKLLQRVKSTCRVQEEEREQIIAKNEKTYDASDEVSANVTEKKGSGMKLRDHLMNRLKNPNSYYQYSDNKQQIPVVPVATGSHSLPSSAVPNSAEAMKYQEPQIPYHGYYYSSGNYYQASNTYPVSQYPVGYDSTSNYSDMTQGLPRSITTNSDNMYRQAGTTPTEVASDSSQYAGYSNFKAEGDYQVQGYPPAPEAVNNYGYQDYQAAKAQDYAGYYQVQPTVTSVAEPVNVVNQSPSHVLQRPDLAPQTQVYPQVQTPVNPVGQVQVNPQGQVHPQIQAQVAPQVQPQIAPQVQAQVGPQVQPQVAPHAQTQVHPQDYLYPAPVSQPLASANYPPTQNYPAPTMASTSAPLPSHYATPTSSVASQYPPNTPTPSSIGNQYAAPVPSMTASVDPMGYYGQMPPPGQLPVTQPDGTYSPYGQMYNQAPTSIPTSYPTDSTNIIQSHAKSSGSYLPNQSYQYSIHGHQSQMYPSYSQGYSSGSWQGQTDSYKGHPGYSFDPVAGAYQYSSGYQQIQSQPQQVTVTDPAHAENSSSHYTSANNGATTNLTPSQYSNGAVYQGYGDKGYYGAQYGATSENQAQYVTNQVPQSSVPGQVHPGSAPAPVLNSSAPSQVTHVPNQVPQGITINNRVPQSVAPNQSITINNQVPVAAPSQAAAPKATAKKSNLDLLADLDITINHAPLVPEVQTSEFSKVKEEKLDDESKEPEPKREDSGLDDRHENLQIVWDTWYNDVQPKRDPLGDPVVLQKFITDIEKYEKFVDSLTVKTLSGSTNLDIKWREIRDFEERESKRQMCSVAVAHAAENRAADWIPYDSTRVKLSSHRSDYINASHVKDLTQWTPMFIITQAPKPETTEAFWTMIWEQGSEVIACLCTDEQLSPAEVYWPGETPVTVGSFGLQLKTQTNHSSYVRRVIGVSRDRVEKVVVHMQYLAWPPTGLPSSPGTFLSFATDIMSEQALRHCPKPIVVHCLSGGPLSGLFLLATSAVCHVRAGHGIIDVPLVFSTLAKYRKCLIDRDLLLFGYRMVLYYAQDSLMKRGILSSTRSTFDGFDSLKGKGKNVKHCHPSDDFLHNLGVGGIATRQTNDTTSTQCKNKTTSDNEDKTDRVKPVDPLSQLDPLWSIRK